MRRREKPGVPLNQREQKKVTWGSHNQDLKGGSEHQRGKKDQEIGAQGRVRLVFSRERERKHFPPKREEKLGKV